MSLRPSRYLALWLGAVLLLMARSGAAQAPNLRVALDYHADAALGCPSAAEFGASVTRQLGYDPFTPESAEQRLRIQISRASERAEAQLEWFDRQQNSEGERRLSSDAVGCTDLARSLAFAVAVQIQLHASAREPPPDEGSKAPPAPAPAASTTATPPKPPPARPREDRPRRMVLLGVGASAQYGFTPGITPGLRVFGAVARNWWLLELNAGAGPATELRLDDGTGFSARALHASLAPCVVVRPLGFCAVGTVGILHVRGQGVDRVGTPSSTIGGVGGRVALIWPELERFGVLLQGEVLAVVTPRDVLLNQAIVWSTAPVAVTATLDFAAIFR